MICRACYHEVPWRSAYCPACGTLLSGAAALPQAADDAAAASGPVWTNPWEARAGRGPVAAFAETLQQALFHPAAFFRGTEPERGAGAALLYAVIVGTLSLAVAFLWQRALGERLFFEHGGRFLTALDSRSALAGITVFLPIGVAVGNIIWAAMLHMSLAVLGGARGTYKTTLKAVCYSSSATAFNVFPVCGAAVGAVWQVVVQVIGLRELHRTSTARALWAWFLPFVVAICLAGAVMLAAMFGLMKLWQEFGGGRFVI